jgi:uncharacterized protein DUF4430
VPFRARSAVAALATVLACAACGLGPGPGGGGVNLNVTRGFGSQPVRTLSTAHVPGSETVMRMLQRSLRVATRYGGGYVQSINGYAGSGEGGRGGAGPTDWFYYVNGVQAKQGAATTAVHQGDHIWWDLHDWRATNSVPAVVGSFPEPFLHGISGKRLPTTLECGSGVSAACRRATAALGAAHVPVSSQLIGTGSGAETLGVVVGTWAEVRPELAAQLLAHGPGASGVYARFAGSDGSRLELLDPAGHVVRTLGPGAGLVAATADSSSAPTWLITGTDAAGVSAAARALTPEALHDHFALAVQGATRLSVPLGASR